MGILNGNPRPEPDRIREAYFAPTRQAWINHFGWDPMAPNPLLADLKWTEAPEWRTQADGVAE